MPLGTGGRDIVTHQLCQRRISTDFYRAGDKVSKNSAGVDGGQLIRIADKQQTGIGANGLEQGAPSR